MELTLTQDFPAGLDHLWSTFGQIDYVRRKYRALGATAVRVRHFKATPEAIDIELERDVSLDPSRLPMWSRALVGPRLTLRHRTAWRRDGPTHATATLDISPMALPLHAQGMATIVEIGSHLTRMRVNWRVVSTAPVVGEMVEHLLAEQVQAALERRPCIHTAVPRQRRCTSPEDPVGPIAWAGLMFRNAKAGCVLR